MPQLGYPHPKQGKVRLRLNLQIRRLQKRLRRRRGNWSLSNPRNWQCRTHQEGVSKATKYTSHAVGEKRMLSTEEQRQGRTVGSALIGRRKPVLSLMLRIHLGTQNQSRTMNLQMAPNDLSTAQSSIRLSPMGWIDAVEQMNVRIGRALTYKAARVISWNLQIP